MSQPTPNRRKLRLKYKVGKQTAVFISELRHGLSLGIPAEPRMRNIHLTVEFGGPKEFPKHHLTIGGGPAAEHFLLPTPSMEVWGRRIQAQISRRVHQYKPSTTVFIPRPALRGKIAAFIAPAPIGRESVIDLRRLNRTVIRFDLYNARRWEPIRLDQVLSNRFMVGFHFRAGRSLFPCAAEGWGGGPVHAKAVADAPRGHVCRTSRAPLVSFHSPP